MTSGPRGEAASAQPWLTIVTVVKDDVAGLAQTAAALGQQNLDGVEWVVIDGSSPPIQASSLPANLLIHLALAWCPPQGVYGAMNEGLRRARGRYVMCVNAGDRLAGPMVVEAIRGAVVDQYPLWLYGSLILEDRQGRRRRSRSFSFSDEQQHRFRRGLFPWHPAMVVDREAMVSAGGFDASYPIAADYRLMLELAKGPSPVELGIPISVFRLDGVSARRWRDSLREAYRARCEAYALTSGQARIEAWWSVPVAVRSMLARIAGCV